MEITIGTVLVLENGTATVKSSKGKNWILDISGVEFPIAKKDLNILIAIGKYSVQK